MGQGSVRGKGRSAGAKNPGESGVVGAVCLAITKTQYQKHWDLFKVESL